jgi:outer membrane receptor protein involved in Fe transport
MYHIERRMMRQALLIFTGIIILVMSTTSQALGAPKVREAEITGKLVDSETGEPVVGAAVQVAETAIGALSDVDGNFVVRRVPLGKHTLVVKCVGYANLSVEGVEVGEKGSARMDLVLTPETVQSGLTVKVTAESVRNTEASLLKQRQLSLVVSDAISSEEITRSGSGNAAAALEKVTGATVVGGKFVYVRGLGDRYASTKLNGSLMPSPDPEKQAAPMDLIPSALLDNIVVEKTFSPDKPGNFAGGSVNLSTKELAGRPIFKYSTSASYNSQATFNDDFLSYKGGSHDWNGFDDGTRGLPDIVKDPTVKLPANSLVVKSDSAGAQFLDAVAKSFNSTMVPTPKRVPMDQSHSLSYGNTFPVFATNVSVLASLSYGRSYKFYDDGIVGRWNLRNPSDMFAQQYLRDTKGVDEVLWGGLLNLSIPLGAKQKIGADYSYTRNAESEARYLVGSFKEAFANDNQDFQTRVLRYTERGIGNLQLSGEHQLETFLAPVKIDWQSSFSNTMQDEPDLRTFSNDRAFLDTDDDGVYDDTTFGIHSNQNPWPWRLYRELDEKNREFSADFSVPFKQWSGIASKFKLGTGFLRKTRHHTERRFEMQIPGSKDYDWDSLGSPDDIFDPQYFGLQERTTKYYWFNNHYLQKETQGHNYDGEQEIFSFYSMLELPIVDYLSLVGGARYEKTLMHTGNAVDEFGDSKNKDVLPSVNAILKVTDDINLRASYGKTLARPTLREIAPFATQEYATGYILNGNVKLKETKIDNYDLRWEYFPRPGEIIAVSYFYKDFRNAIERTVVDHNNNIMYVNVDRAIVYGAEFEVSKHLDQLHRWLRHIQVGGNLTLVRSRVDVPATELAQTRLLLPDAEDTRPMQGQSPYVINLDLAYVNPAQGTSIGLYYNVFGKRIVQRLKSGTPDPYELPRPSLDLTLSQKVWRGVSLKGSAKNILNSKYREVHEYEGKEYIKAERSVGQSFSLGFDVQLY